MTQFKRLTDLFKDMVLPFSIEEEYDQKPELAAKAVIVFNTVFFFDIHGQFMSYLHRS